MNNLMYVRKRYDQKGNLKLEMHCSLKNQFNSMTKSKKEYYQKVKTFTVPSSLKTKKEIEKYSLQCQIKFKEEIEKMTNGIYTDNNILFCDYAEQYIKDIIKYKKDAYNHYTACMGNLKILKEKFGNIKLKEMTLPVIKKFCDWLCERAYIKETYIVKKNIGEIIKAKKLTLTKTYLDCGISSTTLKVALGIGNKVNKETATKICEYLNIPVEDYFTIESKKVPYAKDSNRNLKTLVNIVLQDAVRNGLLEVNYATKDYTKPVVGTKFEKQIYSTKEEIREFLTCVNKEQDIRKKVAFTIALELGVRGAELTGLSWGDINFEEKLVSINKNTMYIHGFGVVTKTTKNEYSTRVITATTNLINLLKEYKLWWDEQKLNHGDVWSKTNKLFVRWDGRDMPNATIAGWLKEFEEKNNLKIVTLHGLRHTNITMLISNGVDVKTVSLRVGHKDIKTTLNIYAHYVKASDEKASQLIEQITCFNNFDFDINKKYAIS